jgi:integrase
MQRKGLSHASIQKYMATVRGPFGDALDDAHVTGNPAAALRVNAAAQRTLQHEPQRVKEMTRGELAAVLGAIPEQHRLVFELMAYTGCRISEALGLDWSDVTFGEPATVRISRQWYRGEMKALKTAAGVRIVRLPAGLAAKLWELGADTSGPILRTRTGHRLSDRDLAQVLAAARTTAGVPGITHHTFRHAHGAMLLAEGWTIPEVARQLGHADPAITAGIYSRPTRDRSRELAFLESLAGRFLPAAPGAGRRIVRPE